MVKGSKRNRNLQESPVKTPNKKSKGNSTKDCNGGEGSNKQQKVNKGKIGKTEKQKPSCKTGNQSTTSDDSTEVNFEEGNDFVTTDASGLHTDFCSDAEDSSSEEGGDQSQGRNNNATMIGLDGRRNKESSKGKTHSRRGGIVE